MNAKQRSTRFAALKQYMCIACELEEMDEPCGPTEIHHLNAFGHAGMKRRGDEYTIPLGAYHHRGVPKDGWTKAAMREQFGPSLANESKEFRASYGNDERLLSLTNEMLDDMTGQD